jgi:hypothetical protein
MTKRAPSITSTIYDNGGALTVNWSIDTFYPDSESPDDVAIEINNETYKDNLGGDAVSLTISSSDIARFPGDAIIITVVFKWSDTFNTSLRDSATVLLPAQGGGQNPPEPYNPPPPIPLEKPVINSVVPFPKYIDKQAKIEIRWSGHTDSTFIDYYWEWLISPYIGDSNTRRIETQIPFASLEKDTRGIGRRMKPNSVIEFEVLLVKNPSFAQRSYSEVTKTSFKTSSVIKSIREFLNGQSANDGLGKTLRRFGHDPKTVINVLRW